MSSNKDSNIRRSTRISTKKGRQINYKEIEEGKEFSQDNDSVEQAAQRNYEEEIVSNFAKRDGKLSHPKKSLTAYTLFVKVQRKKLQEEDPTKTTPELMKEIGRLWKNITGSEKAWYQSMAAKDKERYKREMEEMQRLKEQHKMNDNELKRPKKCLSSYMIFVREVRTRVTQEFPDMNALDVMKEVGRRWQNITPEDKNHYQELANRDKERFKRENQQYLKELDQLNSKLKAQNKTQNQDFQKGNPSSLSGGKRNRNSSKASYDPTNAFQYFSKEAEERIRRENPTMSQGNILKQVSQQWNQMSNKEREFYEKAVFGEKQVAKTKNKRAKTSEAAEVKAQTFEEEHDSFKEQRSFGDDQQEFRTDKEQMGYPDREKKSSQQQKIKSKPRDYNQNMSGSPHQDGSIRFNLPESRPMGFNQPSPNPLPPRKDMGFANNMGPYQEGGNASTDISQSNAYNNMNRNPTFSPMPFIPNRSPGVSPNMVPMYSPMVPRNDNMRDPSGMNMYNMNRNFTAMGQTLSTPVNKNDMGYTDFYQVSASPSGYTPMRTNLARFNPGFSPSQQPDTSSIFGPSPNMMPGMSFPAYPVGKTPVNQYGNNKQMFAAPKPMNPPMGQRNDMQRNMKKDEGNIFDLNPFGG